MVVSYAYSKKYNYIIGWNAKSGCTLFRNIFLHLHKDEASKITNKHHLINLDFPLPSNINNIPIYILVRNPYSRIVSMFTNKYCGGEGHNILYDKMNLETDNFLSFVEFIANLKKNNNLNNFDDHISEQCFNKLNNNINCTILKLESFEKDIINMYNNNDKLKDLLPSVKKYLKDFSNNKIKTNSTTIINDNKLESIDYKLKIYDKNSNQFPNYKYFYGPIIKDIIYNIYKNDFLIYNYDKNNL